LRGYEHEFDGPEIHVARNRSLPQATSAPEVIDLTRSQMRGLAGFLPRRRASV
jgi:hypothetical protein